MAKSAPAAAAPAETFARLPAFRYTGSDSFEAAPTWVRDAAFASVLKPTERQPGDDDADTSIILRLRDPARTAVRPNDWLVRIGADVRAVPASEAAGYGLEPSSS